MKKSFIANVLTTSSLLIAVSTSYADSNYSYCYAPDTAPSGAASNTVGVAVSSGEWTCQTLWAWSIGTLKTHIYEPQCVSGSDHFLPEAVVVGCSSESVDVSYIESTGAGTQVTATNWGGNTHTLYIQDIVCTTDLETDADQGIYYAATAVTNMGGCATDSVWKVWNYT